MNKSDSEIWKTYPEFDFIQGSNLGRVRTVDRVVPCRWGMCVRKGHVLKQHDNGYGYLRVQFVVNRKHIYRYVHRLVAETFLPNPDNLPQINHKDNDRANNCVDNLEWCTSEYNIAYREKYGTSAAEAVGRPLFAVNLTTLEVSRFCSQLEAGREFGISAEHINRVINGELKQTKGYWFMNDDGHGVEIDKDKLRKIKAGMNYRGDIYAISLETQEVYYFRSQREASRVLGVYNQSINKVLKGKRKTAGGYWFTKADENAVEATKNKFCDGVARKVEQLMGEKEL